LAGLAEEIEVVKREREINEKNKAENIKSLIERVGLSKEQYQSMKE
jgi:hypothetical protein